MRVTTERGHTLMTGEVPREERLMRSSGRVNFEAGEASTVTGGARMRGSNPRSPLKKTPVKKLASDDCWSRREIAPGSVGPRQNRRSVVRDDMSKGDRCSSLSLTQDELTLACGQHQRDPR